MDTEVSHPKVTIGITVYNAEKSIETCLCSLFLQSFSNFEVIVIDDGSIDRTVSLIKKFNDNRLVFIEGNENKGIAYRRNQLIDMARSKYLAIQDADDISMYDRVEKQFNFLESNPYIDLVGSNMIVFDENYNIKREDKFSENHHDICRRLLMIIEVAQPTWMGRIEWFKRYRYLNKARAEDQDLLLRAHNDSKFHNIQEYLVGYRQGDTDIKYLMSKYVIEKSQYAHSVLNYFFKEKKYLLSLIGFGLQYAKILVYFVAITANIEKVLLVHLHRRPSKIAENVWMKTKSKLFG